MSHVMFWVDAAIGMAALKASHALCNAYHIEGILPFALLGGLMAGVAIAIVHPTVLIVASRFGRTRQDSPADRHDR